jgi:hypothetical protein
MTMPMRTRRATAALATESPEAATRVRLATLMARTTRAPGASQKDSTVRRQASSRKLKNAMRNEVDGLGTFKKTSASEQKGSLATKTSELAAYVPGLPGKQVSMAEKYDKTALNEGSKRKVSHTLSFKEKRSRVLAKTKTTATASTETVADIRSMTKIVSRKLKSASVYETIH